MRSKATYLGKASLCVFVTLLVVFAPFNVNIIKGVFIEKIEAHAVTPFAGAVDFIDEMSQEAGFDNSGDLIASVAGTIAVATGYNISSVSKIAFGADITENLSALIDAADYPSWNSLSSADKTLWGSEENYDASKFNSLMNGLGFGDAYGRYQNGWGQGGNGEFSFSSTEQTTLDHLGNIGHNWMTGVGNTVDSIINGVPVNKQYIGAWSNNNVSTYHASDNDQLWPTDLPRDLNFTITSNINVYYTQSGTDHVRNLSYNTNVYVFGYNYGTGLYYPACAKTSFKRGESTDGGSSFNMNSSSTSYNNQSFYYLQGNLVKQNSYTNIRTDFPVNGTLSSNISNLSYVQYCIMYGNSTTTNVEMPEYPSQEIANGDYDDIIIYFPVGGINDDTQWDELLTYQEQVTEDLSGIISLLRKIDSDINSGFGRFFFDNSNYLLVKDPVIYSLLNTQLSKFHFNNDGELLVNDPKLQTDFGTFATSFNNFVTAFNTWKSKFIFDQSGNLKVFDSNVNTTLQQILSLLSANNDTGSAPEIIGDFDFDDIADRVPNLLEVIENVAPFGAMLILTELYTVISSINPIDDPEFVVPFQFGGLDDNQEVTIDLSWMDDIKPVINFFCILMLLLAMTRVTMRIVELEAAS